MNAKQVVQALAKRHAARGPYKEWAFFEELRVGTGRMSHKDKAHSPEQRIDAWAINCYPSKKHLRIAYEIKVSRSDFQHEIKHPEKRQRALELSNQYYFAVPKGLVSPDEVPEECGLIYVNENLNSRIVKEAPLREDVPPPDWNFLCSIARRVQSAEEKDTEQPASCF